VSPLPLSVLVPVWNAADTLGDALDDLRAQTFSEFEIVLVDDGSGDRSLAVALRHAASDARIRVMGGPHEGLVPALARGLEACRGEFVARFDADDRCAPTRFERQVAWLRACPELSLVSCLVTGETTDGSPLAGGMMRYLAWLDGVRAPEQIAAQRFIESPIVHPSVMARAAALRAVGGYREAGFPEDYDLWLRMLGAGMRMAKVPETLVTWRDSPRRATRVDARYHADRFRACKLAHLLEGPLKDRREVVVWGAGLEGKPWLRALRGAGLHVRCVAELHAGRIGQRIHGTPCIHADALASAMHAMAGGPLCLVAIGVAAARDPVRSHMSARGFEEGVAYFFVC